MPAPNFAIRQVYNFDMFAPAILGNSYKGATILAIMDRETANREIDTQAMHISVFPHLPAGTPNDPNAYDYVKIKTSAGNTTILGVAWIKEETVTLVESRTITAKIAGVAAGDLTRVRNALIQNGFNNIEVTISA